MYSQMVPTSMTQEVGSLRGQPDRAGVEMESCKIVLFHETLPIHLFRHFCCRMYRLATVYKQTDRQTTVPCQ